MDEFRPSMMDPPIEELLSRMDYKFGLVTLTARRARQITTYFNQLGQGLGSIVPPQVPAFCEKPLSIAFAEINSGKIVALRNGWEEDLAASSGGDGPGPEAANANGG